MGRARLLKPRRLASAALAIAMGSAVLVVAAPSVSAVTDGGAYGWGTDANGQLGNGTPTGTVTTASAVAGPLLGRRVTQVDAGYLHSCAIADGQAYCWGFNGNGELGTGAPGPNETSPVPVVGLPSPVTQIDAGTNSTCAVAAAKVYCWGQDANEKLGNGAGGSSGTPGLVQAEGGPAATFNASPVIDIAVGAENACAVVSTAGGGRVYCWGANDERQMGTLVVPAGALTAYPTAVANALAGMNNRSVTDVSVSLSYSTHVCVVAGGQVFCWGDAGNGRLGLGPSIVTDQITPQLVEGTTGATAVSLGGGHTCAVINAAAYCWGFNGSGQLGFGDSTADKDVPTAVNTAGSLSWPVSDIAAGYYFTCALTDDSAGRSRASCWGANGVGQLGTGSLLPATSGTPMSAGSGPLAGLDLRDISAGDQHVLAVRSSSPSAPTSLQAAAGNATISVSWSPPADDGGSPVSRYEVAVSAPGLPSFACSTTAAARACTASGLVNGATYTVSVRAVNAADATGGITATTTATPTAPPSPPATPSPPAPPAPPADTVPPSLRMARPLPAVSLASAVASWAVSDNSGVAGYLLRTRTATTAARLGAWGTEFAVPASTTSRRLPYVAGSTSCVLVTAIDGAGNRSAPVSGCVAFPLDDRALVAKPRAWSVAKGTAFTFRRALASSQRLATLVLPKATGSRLALVVRKAPGAGTVGVYVRNRRVAVVPLAARRVGVKQVVVVRVAMSSTPVVLRVDVPGRGVLIDGVATLK